MMHCRRTLVTGFWTTIALVLAAAMLFASDARLNAFENDQPAAEAPKNGDVSTPAPSAAKTADETVAKVPTNPADPTAPLKRLLPEYDVWIDAKNKHVVIDGEVCLTRGLLEMFACLKGTKEHESVVSVNTKAYVVHAALLALGAQSGSPAKWQPKYVPATGTQIDIMVYWTDDKGKPQKAPAQDWVRNLKTEKALESPWVFAGSAFHRDDMTGKQYYLAESGDFICVSNFPSALLDLPIESSDTNADLAFEAFTENIPPRGTKVKLVLMPRMEKQAADKILNRRDAETQRGQPQMNGDERK